LSEFYAQHAQCAKTGNHHGGGEEGMNPEAGHVERFEQRAFTDGGTQADDEVIVHQAKHNNKNKNGIPILFGDVAKPIDGNAKMYQPNDEENNILHDGSYKNRPQTTDR
jgi:hypothetical protein